VKIVPIREANALAACNDDIVTSMGHAATWISEGSYGDVRTVVMLIESETGEVARLSFGKATDRARIAGLLSIMLGRMAIE
jgi:hypothetical protein